MPLNSGYNSDLVKTSLDEAVYEEFDREMEPQEVLATDSLFFKQRTTNKQAEIVAETNGPGQFEEHVEEEEIKESTIRTANKTTYNVKNYKKRVFIPHEFYEDEQHDRVDELARQFGLRARTSRDQFAYKYSYGDAFSGVTTPDGAALISNSHTTVSGATIGNLETGAFSPDNLKTMVKSLRLQKAQDGELGGHNPDGLLVSVTDFPEAMEVVEARLKPQSADNDPNYVSMVYPGLRVGTSAYLDSTYNSDNSNVDTSYFLVSRNHMITRWVRESFNTILNDPSMDGQDRWEYRGRYREMVGARGWQGIVGNNGT